MENFDNNMIAVIVYVFTNIVTTAYIYLTKRFSSEKFKAIQALQENILDIVSQPSTARTEIIHTSPMNEPYHTSSRAVEIQHRDIDLGNGRILRIHPN